MKRIGILSDSHNSLPKQLPQFFQDVDEIWHCGDIGSEQVADSLAAFKPLKAVYGNIDGGELRRRFPEFLVFTCEEVKVLMTHIGGYPGKYDPWARIMIEREKPKLFVCGHSHILKVIYDKRYELLHINPGAAGKYGLHRVITLIRFVIDGNNMKDLEISEMEKNPPIR